MPRPLRIALVGGAVPVALWAWLGAVYALDRIGDSGEILGRVRVADTAIGGLTEAEARTAVAALHSRLSDQPMIVTVEETEFTLLPREVGYGIDEGRILDAAMQAGREGGWLGQMGRWLATTFGWRTSEIDLAAAYSRESLIAVLKLWERVAIAEPPTEGGIGVIAGRVVPIYPAAGTGIDLETTADLIEAQIFGDREPVTAVTEYRVPVLTEDDVDAAVQRAQRLISGSVTLSRILPPASVTFPERVLQASISSRVIGPREDPTIEIFFQVGPLIQFVNPIRDTIETPPQDAQVMIRPDDVPLIIPGANGVLVDDAALPKAILDAASSVTRTGPLPVREGEPPAFTTEDAQALGIKELLYTATTFFSAGGDESNRNRVINIQTMADEVDGAIVLPGEVFSINEHVGQRTEAKGYRRAGAIIGDIIYCCDNPANIGGGVSQFATTLYNAVFWAGLEDVQHTPHSLYISRYPMVQEATLGWPAPDLRFRNNTDHAILIKTEYTNTSVTVKLFGDSGGIRVEAETSERTNPTEPEVVLYEGDDEVPPDTEEERDPGRHGFTASVTRIVYNADGSERERRTWVWTYKPWPIVIAVHPCKLPSSHPDFDSSIRCPVQVPDDVVGKTLAQAIQSLNAIGLRVERGEDVIVDDPEQNGLVQRHTPAAGTWVEPGSDVIVRLGHYESPD